MAYESKLRSSWGGDESTNVKGVVVSAETVYECLLRGRLISDHPVWFAVLRDGLRLGSTCNYFRELVAICFGTQIERRVLDGKDETAKTLRE